MRVPHGTSMVFVRTGGPRLPTAYLAFRPPPRVISTASPLVAPSPRPACDPPPLPDLFPALSSPSHSSFLHTRYVRFLSSLGPRPPCPQNHHLGHQAPADPPEQHPAPPHMSQNLHSPLVTCLSPVPWTCAQGSQLQQPDFCIFFFPSVSLALSPLLLLSPFSHVQLCATPWMAAHQALPSTGFSRQEYWSGLPFPSPQRCPRTWHPAGTQQAAE